MRNHGPKQSTSTKVFEYLKPGLARRPGEKKLSQKVMRFPGKPHEVIPPYGAKFEMTSDVRRRVLDKDLVKTTKEAVQAGQRDAAKKAAEAVAASAKKPDAAKNTEASKEAPAPKGGK